MTAARIPAEAVTIEPWQPGDLGLLRALNAPEMTRHLGGPETDEQVVARHERYLRADGVTVQMFRVVVAPDGAAVGSVGFWERTWRDDTVYETGWGVLPAYQGRGVATASIARVAAAARTAGRHRWLHAFPSVDNGPSNAICRKAGFTLLGSYEFEYPPGHPMTCNDWRLDLGMAPRG